MEQITITEALAEIKTIGKRVQSKQDFVKTYLGRFAMNRDPLEKDGGSVAAVASALQAIRDLMERTVSIRRAIQHANEKNVIVVEGQSRSIADWLVWRREVAPQQKALYQMLQGGIANARNEAKKRDSRIVEGDSGAANLDVIISVSESQLANDIENLETILGTLDGQLSLKNATITIKI